MAVGVVLEFEGARSVEIEDQGGLRVMTTRGEFLHSRPYLYQEVRGGRVPVSGRYVLRGRGRVGFEVSGYDAMQPLVIDPVIRYSTYLGGTAAAEEKGVGIAVDGTGAVYVAGVTEATNFPTRSAFQSVHGGGTSDAFVSKLSADGSSLVRANHSRQLARDPAVARANHMIDAARHPYRDWQVVQQLKCPV